jgi:hypothetical protein
MIGLLMFALFVLDCSYSVLLARAIRRTLAVEESTTPQLRLAHTINGIAMCSRVANVVVWLYLLECLGLFLLAVGMLPPWTGPFWCATLSTAGIAIGIWVYFKSLEHLMQGEDPRDETYVVTLKRRVCRRVAAWCRGSARRDAASHSASSR